MPKRLSPNTLHGICLGFIAKNIDHWTGHYEEYHLGQANYLHVLGPFNELNSQLAQDVMNVLIKEQRLSRSCLHLLLFGRALQHLDLSSCNRIVNDEVAGIIASSCKVLHKLDLTNCKRVTSAGFYAIATSLPYLSTLYVTKTNLRSSAAHIIFKNCTELQDVSMKHCQISDQDLMVLCQEVASSKRGTKLKRLDVSYTLVTEMGVRAILKNIPQLQVVEYPSLINCLFDEDIENIESLINSPECYKYKLRSLQCQDFISVSNEMLRAIPTICPQVTQLDLRFAGGFDNSGLCHLAKMHNLKDLQLCCEESEDITFEDGVMPVLIEIGPDLKVLSLQDISGLDPVVICQLCPNLQKLFLLMMKNGKVFNTLGDINNNHPAMTELVELDFWCRNGDNSLSEEALCFILSRSINVESIGLIRVDSFTTNVLQTILRHNKFTCLKRLSLHECHCMTEDGLSDLLLSSYNQLQFVKLINCLQITRRNYEGWERVAKRDHLNIKIDWK
ncbi:uncharacterized protein [Asterias amurensis]|uniref:uncharacterized protein n=1 Tax=Asterias amurensis TaxID=7602 RepID=UPI003AB5E0BF